MKTLIDKIIRFAMNDRVLSRVLKNTGYLFSSTSIGLLLSMIQSIFAARLLGVAAFGSVSIISSFVSNVNRLFSFRMGEFVIRYLGKELTNENMEKAGAVVKIAMLIEALTSLVEIGAVGLQPESKTPRYAVRVPLFSHWFARTYPGIPVAARQGLR